MTIDDTSSDAAPPSRRRLRQRAVPPPLPAGDAPADDDTALPEDTARPEAPADGTSADGPSALEDADVARFLAGNGAADDDPADGFPAEPRAQWADAERTATALTWVNTDDVAAGSGPASIDTTHPEREPDLLVGARLRPAALRAGALVPAGALVALLASYSGTTLLWPLHEVPPTVESVEFETATAEAAVLPWPEQGSAGVSVGGISSAASATGAVPIASVTKVVTALMVLDRLPLQPGEQGPEFAFTYGDSQDYWGYRAANQSALDVPVGGVLTEYQMLQGTLMGSANNYIDRLARELWGSDAEFAQAAATWLADRGQTGITVVTPSGFDERNVATPQALLELAERAMQNPVFAEIVGTASVDLPGAGTVTNTNEMLQDPGVTGIKTGTLVGWNLLTSKDVEVGDTTVHLYTSVLNQDSDEQRLAVTRALFAEVEASLQSLAPAVPAGTVVGEVSTPWGAAVDAVTDADATVVQWNASAAEGTVVFDLTAQRDDGDRIGALTVSGPIDSAEVAVSLADEIPDPNPWWRLTHPLELFGLDQAPTP